MYSSNFFAGWEKVTATRKPWIAAVAGYALGGGCEVAMMADFIIAARQRQVRPARDQARRHAGHGRLAAADPRDRQGQGDGDVPDRADDGRRGGRALRPGRARRPRRRADRRGDEDRRDDRRHGARSPRSPTRRWSTPPSRTASPRASCSSAACSTACSAARTRRKGWRPSSRSARRSGRDAR